MQTHRAPENTHHTLGDGVYGNHESIVEATCCVKVVLTPENAITEIERAIKEAFAKSAPAYIVVPQDVGTMPVVGTVGHGAPMEEIRRSVGNPVELEAAINAIVKRLKSNSRAVLLPSALTARYGLTDKVERLITKTNIPLPLRPWTKDSWTRHFPSSWVSTWATNPSPRGCSRSLKQLILSWI